MYLQLQQLFFSFQFLTEVHDVAAEHVHERVEQGDHREDQPVHGTLLEDEGRRKGFHSQLWSAKNGCHRKPELWKKQHSRGQKVRHWNIIQTDRQTERIMNYFWPLHHNDMHSNSVITNCLGLAKCVSYKWDLMCWTWIWDQKSWKIRS